MSSRISINQNYWLLKKQINHHKHLSKYVYIHLEKYYLTHCFQANQANWCDFSSLTGGEIKTWAWNKVCNDNHRARGLAFRYSLYTNYRLWAKKYVFIFWPLDSWFKVKKKNTLIKRFQDSILTLPEEKS